MAGAPAGAPYISFLVLALCLLLFDQASAKMRLPPPELRGEIRNDLPVPYNLQAVALNKNVTLHWQWQPPEQNPAFQDFGFEIKRHDHPSSAFKEDGLASKRNGSRGGKTAVMSATTYSDFDLAFGTYSYVVRARGGSKEKGKRVNHISDWSEPASATIKVTCSRSPSIELMVEPTKRHYAKIPSLRLHLTGRVAVETGCSITRAAYHIDSGTGITHSGPLSVDPQGRFDAYVDALGPEDEIPEGSASFAVTATAENEAGPTTSSATTINVELQNPFAPH